MLLSLLLLYCQVIVSEKLTQTLLVEEFDQRSPPLWSTPPLLNSRYLYRYNVADITRTYNCSHQFPRPIAFQLRPSASSLKVFGVGLSRTATSSLADFFSGMHLKVIHFDHDLTAHLPNSQSTWNWTGIYDDVDAVFDLPTAFYYEELMKVYPQALFISVYRNPQSWFESFSSYLSYINENIFCSMQLPLTTRLLHKFVYGTEEPDAEKWIRNYQLHYQRVRKIIPSQHLLDLNWDDLKKLTPSPAERVCDFLNISLSSCPNFPHSYSLKDIKIKVNASSACRSFRSVKKLGNSKFAYATLLANPNGNSFKSQFLRAAVVWCQSIRKSYSNMTLDYDIIVLVLGHLDSNQLATLERCFDQITPLPFFGPPSPRGLIDTEYYAIIRSKFWVFAFTEYQRIIFMDADQMIIRNIDHYFFRDFYTYRNVTPPLQVYAQVSNHAPICSAFFSLEPSLQAVIDILALFQTGLWNNKSGWFDYGPFTFDPTKVMVSLSSPTQSWKKGEPDLEFPEVPLFPHPDPKDAIWIGNDWNFYCSWSDQGMLFYYFYLLKNQGGVIDPRDHDHEIVHFIGVHKPWIASYQYSKKWDRMTQWWLTLAHQLNLDSDLDVSSLSLDNIISSFHSKVSELKRKSQARKFVLLQDPYSDSSTPNDYNPDSSAIPVETDNTQTYSLDTTVSDNQQATVFNDVTTVANSQQMSMSSTDSTTSDASAAGVNSEEYPAQQSVSEDLTDLFKEAVELGLHADGIPTSASDLAQSLVEEGVEVASEYALEEELVTTAVAVTALEVVPFAVAAYEGYQLGYEAGTLITHVVSYVESGQASQDVNEIENTVKQWVQKSIHQVLTTFPLSSSQTTQGSKVRHPFSFVKNLKRNLLAVGQDSPSTSSQRNISHFFRYSANWTNLPSLLNLSFNETATSSEGPISYSLYPSADGMLVGVMDNYQLLATYIVRLGWRRINNQTHNITERAPELHLFNATWKARATVYSKRTQEKELVLSGADCLNNWYGITLGLILNSLWVTLWD